MAIFDSESHLRTVYDKPPADYVREAHAPLVTAEAAAYIRAATLMFIGSTERDGFVDMSPRGGPAGFVKVLDAHRIAWAEAPGNNKVLTLTNIVERPQIGVIFMIPGVGEMLRVLGTARVTDDPDILAAVEGETYKAKVAIEVAVAKVFPHCGKALKKSGLLDAGLSPSEEVPSLADLAKGLRAARGE